MSTNKNLSIPKAVLSCLEDARKPLTYLAVYELIKEKNLCNFENAQTPENSVARVLSVFISSGDIRVKRRKNENGIYLYYLTKYENLLNNEFLNNENEAYKQITPSKTKAKEKNTYEEKKTYEEKDLHILLSSYLKYLNIFSKTIPHQQSNSTDKNQVWTHPDMVGIKFLELQNDISKKFIKTTNKIDTFKLYSYEIKKEIISDNDLKSAYFQAVSNSSWANYGYLVAYEFTGNLMDEIERLNQSFGIGVIQLNANPYLSKVLFQAKQKNLDFKTFDKLCRINEPFKRFIEISEILISADEKYSSMSEKELTVFCDKIFSPEDEYIKYCKEKNILDKFEQE